jgi:SOS-response transcriptional repressor LexA
MLPSYADMQPKDVNTLTPRQKEILQYWKEYEEKNGQPPSLSEAMREFKLNSINSIQQFVRILTLKGFMTTKQVPGRMGNVYCVVGQQDNR